MPCLVCPTACLAEKVKLHISVVLIFYWRAELYERRDATPWSVRDCATGLDPTLVRYFESQFARRTQIQQTSSLWTKYAAQFQMLFNFIMNEIEYKSTT